MIDSILDIEPNKININLASKIFFIYGEQGAWKTTVASQFPSPLLLGFELGYSFIPGLHAIHMTSWSDYLSVLRQLSTEEAKKKYKTIVIDTASNMWNLDTAYALSQFNVTDLANAGFGRGFRKQKEEFYKLETIPAMGYCLVIIAHSKIVEDFKTKVKKIKIDLDSTPLAFVEEKADFILYVHKEYDSKGNMAVYAYSDLPNIPTKRRLRTFPRKIYFSYDEIKKGLESGGEEWAKQTNSQVDDINNRIVKQEDWEKVRDELIELIKELTKTSMNGEVVSYITQNFTMPISKTTISEIGALTAARDYLLDLKSKLTETKEEEEKDTVKEPQDDTLAYVPIDQTTAVVPDAGSTLEHNESEAPQTGIAFGKKN